MLLTLFWVLRPSGLGWFIHHTIGVEGLALNATLSKPQVHALFGLGAQQPRPVACPVLVLLQRCRGGLAQPPIVLCRLQVQLGTFQDLDPAFGSSTEALRDIG